MNLPEQRVPDQELRFERNATIHTIDLIPHVSQRAIYCIMEILRHRQISSVFLESLDVSNALDLDPRIAYPEA